jgi:hypothetical protein
MLPARLEDQHTREPKIQTCLREKAQMTRQKVHIARHMHRLPSRYPVGLDENHSKLSETKCTLSIEHTVRIVSAIVVIIAFAVLRAMATF